MSEEMFQYKCEEAWEVSNKSMSVLDIIYWNMTGFTFIIEMTSDASKGLRDNV